MTKPVAWRVSFCVVFWSQRTLEREVQQCQALVIWTDCDREGENIGFEIIHVCKAGVYSICCTNLLSIKMLI